MRRNTVIEKMILAVYAGECLIIERCFVVRVKISKDLRMPGFEPGISQPQCEVLTTILHTPGEAGYRSLYLSHAKRALYHLSYIPIIHSNHITNTHQSHQIHEHNQPTLIRPHKTKLVVSAIFTNSTYIACIDTLYRICLLPPK
jgi:hypothetical protein